MEWRSFALGVGATLGTVYLVGKVIESRERAFLSAVGYDYDRLNPNTEPEGGYVCIPNDWISKERARRRA